MHLKKKYAQPAAWMIAAILVIALFFHFPITIIDALTLEPVAGFGIKISLWRTLFEPLLGLLLYFNQSFYAIAEIFSLLVWALSIILGYTLYKIVRLSGGKMKFLGRQLINLMMVVGLWMALFVTAIFIPLPNNVIVNHTTSDVLVTTHSHTEFSHDGLITQQGLWEWHKRNGFDAYFATDHNNHTRTLQFVQSRGDKKELCEPLCMAGEEYSGTNHLSLLGLKREFVTRHTSDSSAVAQTRIDRGAVLVNHWFDGEHQSLEYYRDLGADGFEIENTATDKRYDRALYQRIKEFCVKNRLLMVGGLDFHGYGSACTIWNAFEIQDWKSLDNRGKEDAILKIIKDRDQRKVKVLLYNDRPYYDKRSLVWRVPLSIINYFRTLNGWQVFSWAVWIVVFALLKSWVASGERRVHQYTCQSILPWLTLGASVFLLGLGWTFHRSIQQVEEFTTVYQEYSANFFTAGVSLLILSLTVLWFRVFKANHPSN